LQTFHTEETGDIIAWQTRIIASQGGNCIIASAYTIYNLLSATRPDIIRTLALADWPFAFPHFHCRPILFYHNSRLIINFNRAALLGSVAHPRPARLPTLTETQLEALDVLESLARATELNISTEPGDMHFINNLCVLHRREEFVDDESTGRKRHLVRMRLRSGEKGWELPEELREEWENAFVRDGDRGKVAWHLEPMPEGWFPMRKYPIDSDLDWRLNWLGFLAVMSSSFVPSLLVRSRWS
jgi:hypothetical protein